MSAHVRIRVRGYGSLGEIVADGCEIAVASSSRTDSIREELNRAMPELSQRSFRIAAFGRLCTESETLDLADGVEVALFPPFAGG